MSDSTSRAQRGPRRKQRINFTLSGSALIVEADHEWQTALAYLESKGWTGAELRAACEALEGVSVLGCWGAHAPILSHYVGRDLGELEARALAALARAYSHGAADWSIDE